MSFLRRYIIVPITLWLTAAGAAALVLGLALEYFIQNPSLQVILAVGIFFVLTIIVLIIKLHIPLKLISTEMKALLTGKSYRRIMTTKRNEIGIMAHFFNEITRNLESITSDVKSHKRIQKELNVAQQIQRDLLPKQLPEFPNMEIVAKTRPASEIGGDTFDFYSERNRHLLYIGDSTGHGVPAGIVMVMVDTLLETFIDLQSELREVMIMLNKYLKPHLQTTMFMTMILAEWIPESSELKWIGAGHEYIIHFKTSTGELTTTASGGIAVGMLPDNTKLVNEQALKLAENDFIVLYTDGINEAKNITGEIYSLERLGDFIKTHATAELSAEDLFKEIAIDVGRFMEGAPQEDDMTLIVMKHTTKVHEQDKSTEWEANEENVAKQKAPVDVEQT